MVNRVDKHIHVYSINDILYTCQKIFQTPSFMGIYYVFSQKLYMCQQKNIIKIESCLCAINLTYINSSSKLKRVFNLKGFEWHNSKRLKTNFDSTKL